jgi:hypothetical protein
VPIETASIVRARTFREGQWSTLSEVRFAVEPSATLDNLRVSEVQYHPADPSTAEMAAGFGDADEFEYIELVNIGSQPIDLSGLRFEPTVVDGEETGIRVDFGKDAPVLVQPGEYVVVVENRAAFTLRYGAAIRVLGQWTGGLSNSSETLTLVYPDGGQHQFTYSDRWHRATDGDGPSLEILDPSVSAPASWSTPLPWTTSALPAGSPGRSSRVPGDVSGDRQFDATDLVLAHQAGEYRDSLEDNSTFDDGDWDGDGDFDTSDLVFVFALGLWS